MPDIFAMVLRMSLAGSIVTLLLFASQKMAKIRFSAKWRYYSGIAALIFLLLPMDAGLLLFGENISLPFFSKQPVAEISKSEKNGDFKHAADIGFSFGDMSDSKNTIQARSPAAKKKPGINSGDALKIAAYVWLLGIAVLSAMKIAKYAKSKRYLKKSAVDMRYSEIYKMFKQCKEALKIKRKIGLYCHCGISTPMAAGLFDPAVYLPDIALEAEETRLILEHELIHVKRRDLWYKFILMAARVIHWFNPLCFLLEKETNILCELSCDETLVKDMGKNEKKFYCRTILNTISAANDKLSVIHATMGDGRKQIERRFENMLSYKKGTIGTAILSVLSIAAIVGAGLCAIAINLPETTQPQGYKSENANLLIGAGETKADESPEEDENDENIAILAGEPATDTVSEPQPDWRVQEMYERGYRESLEYTKFKDSSFNQRMIDVSKEENDFIYKCLLAGDIEMIRAIADDIAGLHTYDADGRMMVALELEDGRMAEFEIKFD